MFCMYIYFNVSVLLDVIILMDEEILNSCRLTFYSSINRTSVLFLCILQCNILSISLTKQLSVLLQCYLTFYPQIHFSENEMLLRNLKKRTLAQTFIITGISLIVPEVPFKTTPHVEGVLQIRHEVVEKKFK